MMYKEILGGYLNLWLTASPARAELILGDSLARCRYVMIPVIALSPAHGGPLAGARAHAL